MLVHRLLNDPLVSRATNVVVLQTTATPYTLVTKNSRIDSANIYDMYERHPAHRENYYGLEKFVKNSLKTEDSLDPGTYTTDVGFENIVISILIQCPFFSKPLRQGEERPSSFLFQRTRRG